MDQISAYEREETLACGLFNYKIHFLIPVSNFLNSYKHKKIKIKMNKYLRKTHVRNLINNYYNV